MDASKCQAVLVASETGSFSAAAELYPVRDYKDDLEFRGRVGLSNFHPQQKGRSLNGKWAIDVALF